jgi:N-acetyl-anhydromuramyl-L-alanine amidase AmpD
MINTNIFYLKGLDKNGLPIPATPNRSPRQFQVSGIIVHRTAGTRAGSLSWLCNPKAMASAHYVVGRKNEAIVELLDPNLFVAWHAGHVSADPKTLPAWALPNPNLRSVGIEFVDDLISNNWWTSQQIEQGVWLIKTIANRFNFSPMNVLGHMETDPKRRPHDPSTEFLQLLRNALQ